MTSSESTPELLPSIPHASSNSSSQSISSESSSPLTNPIAPATPSNAAKRASAIDPTALAFKPVQSVKNEDYGLATEAEDSLELPCEQSPSSSTLQASAPNTQYWSPHQTLPFAFPWPWSPPFAHTPRPWDIHGHVAQPSMTPTWFHSPVYSYPGPPVIVSQPWHPGTVPHPLCNGATLYPHTHGFVAPMAPLGMSPEELFGSHPSGTRPSSSWGQRLDRAAGRRSRHTSASAALPTQRSSSQSLNSIYAVAASQYTAESRTNLEQEVSGPSDETSDRPTRSSDSRSLMDELRASLSNRNAPDDSKSSYYSNEIPSKRSSKSKMRSLWSQSTQWTSSGKKELATFQRIWLNLCFMGADQSPFIPKNVMDFATFRIQIAEDRKAALARRVAELLSHIKKQSRPAKAEALFYARTFNDDLSPFFAVTNCFCYKADLADLASASWPTVGELKTFHSGIVGTGIRPLSPSKGYCLDHPKVYEDCRFFMSDSLNSYYILPVDGSNQAAEAPLDLDTEELPVLTMDLVDFIDQDDVVFAF